jgi:hypothetical protein
MKKIATLIIKIVLGIILVVFILLFTLPVIFKEKIRTKVEQVINESLNASVKFEDYRLGFFRNFPNLSFSLNGLSVVGVDEFKNDTLAGFKSFDLVFNLASLFKKSGYEIKSIVMDKAVVHAIVLKNGKANWDIVKETPAPAPAEKVAKEAPKEEKPSASGMKVVLKKVALLNSNISYVDDESSMKGYLNNLNFSLKGDMTTSETNLLMSVNINDLTFIMDGLKYLNRATVDAKIGLMANLDSMRFTFGENYLTLNEIKMNFSGLVKMPGDNIDTDVKFGTEKTSFKSLLSLVPAVYMKDYKDLKTSGEFSFTGTAKGTYSDADSTLPDITLNLLVNNGLISYPSLPEQIRNINIRSNVFVDGRNTDRTIADIDQFHMELAGSPFDMTFHLKTPVSDPDFNGSLNGKIDLAALSKAIPMDSMNLSGIIDMAVQMAGRMSLIEKSQYEKVTASGKINVRNMLVSMTGYPDVKINDAAMQFSPAYATLTSTNINVGKRSDFLLGGRLENYIPYIFSNKTLKGNLSLHSKLVDASEIMSQMATDTTTVTDTTALAVIRVPKNINFDLNAAIDQFSYDKIKATNLKGHILVRDGILSVRETGMDILSGNVSMNADYDTRDTLKPVMKADFDVRNISVKDAFTTFNSVQKLAPAAKGVDGRISVKLNYESLLGSDMMPVVKTINGGGKLHSEELALVESSTFDKIKETLKLGNKYTNTFKDVNISFKIQDGRIFVSPFDIRTGNLKMNIGGDQGIDQTINYIVKTEMPRSDLGSSVNSLIDNLSAQASAFGIKYKPSETLKVNLKVTGTFTKPVIAPFFGSAEGGGTSGGVAGTAKETVKQAVSDAADKAKEKGRAEAEAQAAKLISEAEQSGQQLREEAAKAAEKLRQEADVQAKKLTDGAESKGTIAKISAQKGAETIRNTADRQADQLTRQADEKARKLVEEAKAKSEELFKKF